jgi:RimJ/RimL family protein N-acetyltransferase
MATASDPLRVDSELHAYEATDEVEIGWTFLARSRWGGQYNREMKRLMLEHAFRYVGRVVFLRDPANHRSQRSIEKSSAVRAGVWTDASGWASCVFQMAHAPAP